MRFILTAVALFYSMYCTAQVQIKNLCGKGVSMKINSSQKLKLYENKKNSNIEEHSLYPTNCSYRILHKSSKAALSVEIVDSNYDHLNNVKVDSCFLKRIVNNNPAQLCRYTIRSHHFIIADIEFHGKVVRLLFNKKDYKFAMDLMDAMSLMND